MWEFDIHPFSGFLDDYKKLTDKNAFVELLNELVKIDDPEDHECAIDCPHIPGVYAAVKFMCRGVLLIVSLNRLNDGTEFEQKIIALYSCSNYISK